MSKDNGGPAFPIPRQPPNYSVMDQGSPGMTLRDYFAAKAMAALVGHLQEGIRPQDLIIMSEDAYMLADAMLAAREKSQ